MPISNHSKSIVVFGANGRLGREIVRAFHAKGWHVRAVTRDGNYKPDTPQLDDRLTCVKADAMDRASVVAAAEGCAFLFNGLNPIYTDWKDKALPMAENILSALEAHGSHHLFPGNLYNFGNQLPALLTEETPFEANTQKGAIRIEMEKMFKKWAEQKNIPTTVLRAGDFFGGEGRGAWFDLMIASKVKKGKVVYPGPEDLVHAWAYLPDLAVAFERLASRSAQPQGFENLHFAGHTITGQEMIDAISRATGIAQKKGSLPWWFIRLGSPLVPMWREISEISYLWHRPHELVSKKLEQEIGEVQRTPLDRAIRESLMAIGIETAQRKTPKQFAGRMALPTFAA